MPTTSVAQLLLAQDGVVVVGAYGNADKGRQICQTKGAKSARKTGTQSIFSIRLLRGAVGSVGSQLCCQLLQHAALVLQRLHNMLQRVAFRLEPCHSRVH